MARGILARGNAPGEQGTREIVRPEGAEGFPAPIQGARQLFDLQTQGVALG
jgi:hypothetical protein